MRTLEMSPIRGIRTCALLCVLLGLVGAAFAVEAPIPPVPATFVTDEAALLSAGARNRLESCLRGLDERSGRQVLVYVGRSLGDVPIEDFAVRAFKQWSVGRQGKDDGLVEAVTEAGAALATHFPRRDADVNELSDAVHFGREPHS